jgi:hypothetical protein
VKTTSNGGLQFGFKDGGRVVVAVISKIWLIACRSGMSKISVLKDIYLENRFIYNKLEAILFEEMRRIDLLWEIVKYTASFL